MKKIIKFMTIILLVSTFVVTGCGKKESKVVEHDIKKEEVEVDSEIEKATLTDTKTVETYYGANDDNVTGEKVVVIYKNYVLNEEEFSVIKAYDKADKVIWTYTTEKAEAGWQIGHYDLLGSVFVKENGALLIRESKNISVLDAKTGKKLNTFSLEHSLSGDAELLTQDSVDNKDYIFVGGLNLISGLDEIIVLDSNYEIVKRVQIPSEYNSAVYEVVDDGTKYDYIYLSFSRYDENAKETVIGGFYLVDILKDNFDVSKYIK